MHAGGVLHLSAMGLAEAAGLALALVLLVFIICTTKFRIRAAERPVAPPSEFEEVRRRLADLEALRMAPAPDAGFAAAADSAAASVRPGMNLSRRSQALRLARRGESPAQIASILGLAGGEVRLLLKIHGILMQQAMGEPGGAPLKSFQDSADTLSSAEKAHARAVKPV